MLFMRSNFICDIKFYLWYQKIFNFKYFLNEGNFFVAYFLQYQPFYDMKQFFKQLLKKFYRIGCAYAHNK